MANRIVSVHAGIYGMGIYAIMLPSSGFSVTHSFRQHFTLLCIIILRLTEICKGTNHYLNTRTYMFQSDNI